MILNRFITTYVLFSILSLAVALGAVITAGRVRKSWWAGQSPESQYELEKKVYLIITLIGLGFMLRLLMVPLWFFTLQSMIPSVSGAMCLFGVHQMRSPVSWISTGLKILLPFFYGFWLVLNYLDRKLKRQPFMETKLRALFPLGLIMLVESGLDLRFLLTVPPRQVSCCTSFFDAPPDAIPQILTQTSWFWVGAWYLVTFLIIGESMALYFLQKKGRLLGGRLLTGSAISIGIQSVVVIAALACFFLALHTKISPLFLHLPFHHCIFCLWQGVWDGPVFTALILVGLWSFLTYVGITSLKEYEGTRHETGNRMTRLLVFSAGSLVAGLAIVTLHLLVV